MAFLTEDLIENAKRSEFFPISQNTFTDPDDLIAFANQEMQSKIVPAIMSARENYFMSWTKVALRSGLNHYGIPERAIGNDLKDVFYVPDMSDLEKRVPIPRTDVHNVASWPSIGAMPTRFYMQGDEVVVTPAPQNVTGKEGLLFFYYMRPNRLVQTSSCAKITAVNSSAGVTTFTVDTDLTLSLPVGALVDVLSAMSPYKLWSSDVVITGITATSISVATTSVSDESQTVTPMVGDYICPAQTACIPMLPQEFHHILGELICFRALKALGAEKHLAIVASNVKDMLQGAMKLISNRVESEPEVVYDRHGLLGVTNHFGYQLSLR